MSSKVLMIILDGIADRPIDNKTPLLVAKTPNLDSLAMRGINGIMDPISPGIRAGSDVGHLALLGYDPYKYYTGRGPIEAAGTGINIKEGDIAFRANFATVEEKDGSFFEKKVIDRRAGRFSQTDELVEAVMDELSLDTEFILKRGSGHRAALILRGEDLSDKISDVDPKKEGKPPKKAIPLVSEEAAINTARLVNKFSEGSHDILRKHSLNKALYEKGRLPANALLLRGPGKVPRIESFKEKYGLSLGVVTGTSLIKGIGKMLGGIVIDVEGATGSPDTNIEGKIKAALDAIKRFDVVILHIKAFDELAHDGDFQGKVRFIEKVDKALTPILSLNNCCIVVTADHSTPISVRNHSGDPVPVTLVDENVRRDRIDSFDEFSAPSGGLCRIRGLDLMPIIMDLIGVAEKYGA